MPWLLGRSCCAVISKAKVCLVAVSWFGVMVAEANLALIVDL